MGPTAQKRACGVAAPLLPHRTRTGNAVARATHRALPGVQVSMQSRQHDLRMRASVMPENATLASWVQVPRSRRHDLLAPTVCEALCRKMQRKRAPPWPHGVAQGRSPNVWCSMDPRYAGKCNGNAPENATATRARVVRRVVARGLRAARGALRGVTMGTAEAGALGTNTWVI
jgi:hypothetical protein